MELDVQLHRDGESQWGFRLIGGRELDLPLTIIEILPNSPAEKADLRNGDAIARIGGKSTANLSLAEAILLVDEADHTLSFGILRGLYDPVIDDQDPVLEEPADFDQRSEPTEEEIREIQRKSFLLKSAIDETIKSIEEYKEEVSMESKKEVNIETTSKSISSNNTVEINIADENNASKETKITEMSNAEVVSNGETPEIAKEVLSVVPNGDIKENFKINVTNEVEEIKKIVQNTEKITHSIEANNIKSKTETVENKDSEIMRIENKEPEIEMTNEAKEEVIKETTVEDITQIVKENLDNTTQDNIKQKDLSKPQDNKTEVDKQTSENTSEVVKATVDVKIEESRTKEDTSVIQQNTITEVELNKQTSVESSEVVNEKVDIRKDNNEDLTKKVQDTKTVADNETSEVDLEVKEVLKQVEDKIDPLLIVRPVEFHPENIRSSVSPRNVPVLEPPPPKEPYKTETGEIIGTIQGIVDGLEEAIVDEEVAKELGKPGLPDEKIAELISGEAEMLREAHVMGLSRVLSSHMHREDDSSVDFKRIKPLVESLKDSEVLKALNEELLKTREEKKKEERRWTTFLQKPSRPVPRAKGGYPGYFYKEEALEEPYTVKIVKQPKPKVAPDYKPEDFDTGPLPWEEREKTEAVQPPANLVPEEPILVPEEPPEFLEAVDPLPESAVPDLEDTGIPLPPPLPETEQIHLPEELKLEEQVKPEEQVQPEEESKPEDIKEEKVEVMESTLVENLVRSVHNMVDPNASLEQQLAQMRAQLAALAELPGVIQQTLELVTRQLFQLTHQQSYQPNAQAHGQQVQNHHQEQLYQDNHIEEVTQPSEVNETNMNGESIFEEQNTYPTLEEVTEPSEVKSELSQEEINRMKREEIEMLEEQRRTEKQKKIAIWNEIWPWGDAKSFGRKPRVNFMKYEKPPQSLDHLKNSEVYKLIHDMDETPLKRVELLTPVIAEADYRERCRSRTPNIIKPHNMPQQLMP